MTHREQNLYSEIVDKSSPTALLALVTQIAGEWALVPCTNCHNGLGDWARCVIPPPAQGGITSWACANCVRKDDGQGCSLRSGTTAQWRHLQSSTANKETYPAESYARTTALDRYLAAEDGHDSVAGGHAQGEHAGAASTEHSDDVSIAMETGSTSSTGFIEAKCSTSQSGLDGLDLDEVQPGGEQDTHGQTQLVEEDGGTFENNNELDHALRIEFDEGDIAVMETGKLLREPLMTLQELQREIRGWYE